MAIKGRMAMVARRMAPKGRRGRMKKDSPGHNPGHMDEERGVPSVALKSGMSNRLKGMRAKRRK